MFDYDTTEHTDMVSFWKSLNTCRVSAIKTSDNHFSGYKIYLFNKNWNIKLKKIIWGLTAKNY